MQDVSRNKSLYRYSIDTQQDIKPETFKRRNKKREQNGKTSFFFDVSEEFSKNASLVEFFIDNLSTSDLICIPAQHYEYFYFKVHNANFVLSLGDSQHISQKIIEHWSKKQLTTCHFLLKPTTTMAFKNLETFAKQHPEYTYYWCFQPYDQNVINSITIKDICSSALSCKPYPGLEIYNTRIPEHYELEPLQDISYKFEWNFSSPSPQPKISIIIPTYNSSIFLANVVWHLINQNISADLYEIVIVDDGGKDNSSALLFELFSQYRNKVNLRFIYWKKDNPIRGEQYFFRPGLARNLAARYSQGEYLFFLDSDMLVPSNFIEVCLQSFSGADILQFQRFHIHQELSKTNPRYTNVNKEKDTYIEEQSYWSELFFSESWQNLPFYWKYTCTYALGIKKEHFNAIGKFKKYYISYGFEDTDLGYEAHLRGLKFRLVKTPLYHLTAYDQMQYKNSFTKRVKLLRVTAELFFLQHLNPEIYSLLGNFYRSQKPLKAIFRDLMQ